MMTDEDEKECRKTCVVCELGGPSVWPCARRKAEEAAQARQDTRLEQMVRRVLREELARVLVAPKGK